MNEPRLFLAWNFNEAGDRFNVTVFCTAHFESYIRSLEYMETDDIVDLNMPFAMTVMPCTEAELANSKDMGEITLAPSFDDMTEKEMDKLVLICPYKELFSQRFDYLGVTVHRFGTGWLYNNRNYLTEKDVCDAINKVILP